MLFISFTFYLCFLLFLKNKKIKNITRKKVKLSRAQALSETSSLNNLCVPVTKTTPLLVCYRVSFIGQYHANTRTNTHSGQPHEFSIIQIGFPYWVRGGPHSSRSPSAVAFLQNCFLPLLRKLRICSPIRGKRLARQNPFFLPRSSVFPEFPATISAEYTGKCESASKDLETAN